MLLKASKASFQHFSFKLVSKDYSYLIYILRYFIYMLALIFII